MPAEYWLPVPEYPGVTVSSWGRVLLPPSEARMPHGGLRKYETKPTLGYWNGTRYTWTSEKHFGTHVPIKVHQLVCSAFHGPKPFEGAVVMHLDENGANNCPYNLQWGTQKENLNAPGFLDYCRSRTGDKNPYVKGTLNLARG